MFEANLDDY